MCPVLLVSVRYRAEVRKKQEKKADRTKIRTLLKEHTQTTNTQHRVPRKGGLLAPGSPGSGLPPPKQPPSPGETNWCCLPLLPPSCPEPSETVFSPNAPHHEILIPQICCMSSVLYAPLCFIHKKTEIFLYPTFCPQ